MENPFLQMLKDALKDPSVVAALRDAFTITQSEPTGYLDASQAAAYIGQTRAWVLRKQKQGILNNYGTAGKFLFCPNELKLAAKENTKSHAVAKLRDLTFG